MFFVSGKFVTVGIHCMGAEKLLIIQVRKFFLTKYVNFNQVQLMSRVRNYQKSY